MPTTPSSTTPIDDHDDHGGQSSQDVAILRLLVCVGGDLATLDAAWGDRWASRQVRRMIARGICGGCRPGRAWPTGAGWAMLAYDDNLHQQTADTYCHKSRGG